MFHAAYDRRYWEGRYAGHGEAHRESGAAGAGDPNPQLSTETADLVPGTALDAGCGTGTDALWPAGRGWHVTAVDIAENALETARARAEAHGGPAASRVPSLSGQYIQGSDVVPEGRCSGVSGAVRFSWGSRDFLLCRGHLLFLGTVIG